MQVVKVEGLDFTASDPEVLTKDRQRIGVSVRGVVLRPGLKDPSILLNYWSTYGQFYKSDALLVGSKVKDKDASGKEIEREVPGLIQSLSQQAMKVCVGELNFEQAAVGAARDVLRDCIDKELDKPSIGYGLEVRNIVVPNIVLSKAVQDALDAITSSRLATIKAEQEKLQAEAEAQKNLATQRGTILVEQGRVQEKAKQDAITARLDQEAKVAQAQSQQAAQVAQAQADQAAKVAQAQADKASADAQAQVITAQKNNELLAANNNLKIQEVNRQIAEERAKAEVAQKVAEAVIYQNNPRYAEVVNTKVVADAYKITDKLIIPVGTTPAMVVGGSGQTPQVVVQTPAKP